MITMTNKEFQLLTNLIKDNYGINLTEKKKNLVESRLNMVLVQENFKSFSEFYKHLIKDSTGKALTTLINRITTNHTYFMRELPHFEFMLREVLPFWISRLKDEKDLCVWSAGCSSGEEPYTLEMVISDYLGTDFSKWNTNILATDISLNILETAKKGIYTEERIKAIPPKWKLSYFKKIDNNRFAVIDRIKERIIFRRFNLMNGTFPFKKKFNVIFCRNVMIYFDKETKETLVNKFYNLLEPGGYLFIGHSESLDRSSSPFKYIMPSVYRRDFD
ncbi:MAG: CheR family methyltransferase [Eubacteriales bacterium]